MYVVSAVKSSLLLTEFSVTELAVAKDRLEEDVRQLQAELARK